VFNKKEKTILDILGRSDREMYGLEIVQESKGILKKGSIYVYLQWLEEQKLISSRKEDLNSARPGYIPRRLYRIMERAGSAT
jgi:DNA-binding PadR family transcriptional regulator